MELITENEVKEAVEKNLPKRYYRSNKCFSGQELETKNSKRADVLIVYKKRNNRPYCIAIEAKSRLTLGDLKPIDNLKQRLVISRTFTIAMFTTLILLLGYSFSISNIYILILLLLFLTIIISVSILLKKLNWRITQTIPAIKQLEKYPANEKWIAISNDTFVNKNDFEILKKECRKNRIGLLIVDRLGRLKKYANPIPKHELNNYIDYYKKSLEIKDFLKTLKVYGKTPYEKLKLYLNIGLFVKHASIPILGFLLYLNTFDNNYRISRSGMDSIPEYLQNKQENSQEYSKAEDYSNFNLHEQECEQFLDSNGKYIIVDQICKTTKVAKNRVEKLVRLGYENATYINSNCLNTWIDSDKMIVHTNYIFEEESDAIEQAKILHKRQIENGIEIKYGKPLKLKL